MNECKPLAEGKKFRPGVYRPKKGGAKDKGGTGAGEDHDIVGQDLASNGKAVQVDPIKPTLKAPGTERVKLKHGEPP